MGLYDETAVLAAIDRHAVVVLLLCGGALVANLVWFSLSLRASRRDHLASCSPLAVLVFLPHDVSYLYRFEGWFVQRDHWFPQLFWAALIVMVVFELIFWTQLWRLGHHELAPFWSKAQFRSALIGATAASFVIWELVKHTLDDPLYLGSFMALIALSPVFGASLLSRRGNTAGQSASMWWAFTAMATAWAIGSIVGFGDDMRTPLWITAAGLSIAGGAAMAVAAGRLPGTTAHHCSWRRDPLDDARRADLTAVNDRPPP